MTRPSLNDLAAFLAVAREQSFTRAAAKLGVSQSSLSQTVRNLEERLGLKLLARTTRSVAPTAVGQTFMRDIAVHIEGIEKEIATLGNLHTKPQGNVRISSSSHAVDAVLWPKLKQVLRDHPDVKVEIIVNNGFIDIVSEGFDAGVRLGESVAKDMIAVRIGPDVRMACVASPAYFAKNPPPRKPQDLVRHACINLRLPRLGGNYQWEFEKGRSKLNLRVEGQLTFSDFGPCLAATLDGFGVAYLGYDIVKPHIEAGELQQVLTDWCPYFPGYHLYYPSRLHGSSAFAVVVDALRFRR